MFFSGSIKKYKNYIEQTSWMLAEKILQVGVSFVVAIYLARYLGPDSYGALTFAIALVSIFAAFADLGLDGIFIRDILKKQERENEVFGSAFFLKTIASVIVFVFFLFYVGLTDVDVQTGLIVVIIGFGVLFQPLNFIDLYYRAHLKSKYPSRVKISANALSSVLRLMLIFFAADLVMFAIVSASESLFVAVGFLYLFHTHGKSPKQWKFEPNLAIIMLKEACPLVLSVVAVSIYVRIDQVMLKEMLGNYATGNYSVAVSLSQAWYFVPMTIMGALYPGLVKAKRDDESRYYFLLGRLYLLMTWMAFVVAIPVTFYSEEIVVLLFGDQYRQAALALAIHCWAALFVFAGLVSNQWYILENLSKLTLYRHLLAAVCNILLNFIMIPVYGIAGAAIATLVTQVVTSYGFDLFNRKTIILFKLKTRYFFLFLPISLLIVANLIKDRRKLT